MGTGGFYMNDNRIFGGILLFIGTIILIWVFKNFLKELENNIQLKLDAKIDKPKEPIFEQEFISFKDAIALFVRALDSTQGIDKETLDGFYDLSYSNYLKKAKQSGSNIEKLPKEIFMLFYFITKGVISLYGYKLFSIDKMKPSKISVPHLEHLDFYNIDNWSKDFSTLYEANKTAQYQGISIKSSELYYLMQMAQLSSLNKL
jgi:hypothetical protein